ncbi:MAG: hypothetical protein ACXWKM_08400 [Phenylobacterium sp.]
MSSISAVSATPPSIPITSAKPAENDKTGVVSAPDHDGDKDDGVSVSAAKPAGQGKIVDIKA